MKKNSALPAHVQFFLPILAVLRQSGGSASPAELKDGLVTILEISDEELDEKFKTGVSRIDNLIAWSKVYLIREGLLDTSHPNVLTLTEDGFKRQLTDADVLNIFKKIHREFVTKKHKQDGLKIVEEQESQVQVDQPHKEPLLKVLKSLPPEGFERLCQRLLRASGFTRVVVTGRSGDGGIDGEGILELNALVSMKVIFQAKRYRDAVSPSEIRDFRGAMQGRAQKGIFITTGRFTHEARKEAFREGVPPIELVDGDKLVQLFEQTQLGLTPKTIYEIDYRFFDEYRR
ncbi:MAG TPA: restriction endonuclease [Syntrophobacteraceae bacterium]|nr:restriction endonuclease [Syntrophobacteraceae bacterium]